MNTLVVVILLTILTLLYVWVKKRFNYWADRGFLQAEASFPLGSLSGVGSKITFSESLDGFYKKFKGKAPAIGIYNFLSPVIFAIDREFVKNVNIRDFQSFHDRNFYYNKKDDPVSANILTLGGQDWRDRRVKLSPIFTSGKMKMMFDIINSISDKFVTAVEKDVKNSSECEMRLWAQRFTSDNIGNVAFGLECNCLDDANSQFMTNGRKLFDLDFFESLKFAFASEFPDISRKMGILFMPKEVGDFFLNTFLKALEYREKNPVNRNDFVQLLLGLKDKFTPTQLAAEAFLVYAGGFETSSTLTQFTLYELALNPDIQDRLREEIIDGIETNDGELTYDMLFGFKYLDMVINESLRKYPPIPSLFRKCTKEYQIPNTKLVIPKGTSVIVNVFSLHRDAEYYPEPDKFDPERFSDENIDKIHPYTFLPFGTGPRNCLGERFGLMQSKIGVVKMIKNFKFSPSKKTPIPMKFVPSAPFLAPVGGMYLNVERI